jgi:hypothetical protein
MRNPSLPEVRLELVGKEPAEEVTIVSVYNETWYVIDEQGATDEGDVAALLSYPVDRVAEAESVSGTSPAGSRQ